MNLYRLGLSWTTLKPALTILGTLGPILNTIRPLDPLGLLCTPLECSLAPYTTEDILRANQLILPWISFRFSYHLDHPYTPIGLLSILLDPLKSLWTKSNLLEPHCTYMRSSLAALYPHRPLLEPFGIL